MIIEINPIGATFSILFMIGLVSFAYYLADKTPEKPHKKRHVSRNPR